MISSAATVDAFLAGLPAAERAVFARLRQLFRRASPRVEESMKYRMPTYLIGDQPVGAFNKQKNYLCLYCTPEAVDPHRAALAALDCGKSCIRFRRPGDLPLAVAAKIIQSSVKLALAR